MKIMTSYFKTLTQSINKHCIGNENTIAYAKSLPLRTPAEEKNKEEKSDGKQRFLIL
jgi:hypothetical protein